MTSINLKRTSTVVTRILKTTPMLKKSFLFASLLFLSKAADAQVTDPMITDWWFNTTNHMYNGILTDVEAVYYTTTNVYVKTSGVPNYYLDGQSVNNAVDLNATWQIPRVPMAASSPTGVQGGQLGLMLDGSVFFHPGDAQSYNNAGVWNRLAYYFEKNDMDASNGHSTPTKMYHHHFDNLKLHGWDSSVHSPIVAYAWDGYPMYGPFGYVNTDGTGGITRMRSSYAASTSTTRVNGPSVSAQYPAGCFIEDWSYVAGSGHLDAHNGRFCKTPEYPSGTYAYFTTVDASLNPTYPYFIGPKFYGVILANNTGPTGGSATIPSTATQYNPVTSVADIETLEASVELYPIPVIDVLTVRLKNNDRHEISIYDLKGRAIMKTTATTSEKIDMTAQPYGVYFVQVYNTVTKSGFVKRIVKQ
jgi:hypothetical protein